MQFKRVEWFTKEEQREFETLAHAWCHWSSKPSVEFTKLCIKLWEAANPMSPTSYDYSPEQYFVDVFRERIMIATMQFINKYGVGKNADRPPIPDMRAYSAFKKEGANELKAAWLSIAVTIIRSMIVTDWCAVATREDLKGSPKVELIAFTLFKRDGKYIAPYRGVDGDSKIMLVGNRGLRDDIREYYRMLKEPEPDNISGIRDSKVESALHYALFERCKTKTFDPDYNKGVEDSERSRFVKWGKDLGLSEDFLTSAATLPKGSLLPARLLKTTGGPANSGLLWSRLVNLFYHYARVRPDMFRSHKSELVQHKSEFKIRSSYVIPGMGTHSIETIVPNRNINQGEGGAGDLSDILTQAPAPLETPDYCRSPEELYLAKEEGEELGEVDPDVFEEDPEAEDQTMQNLKAQNTTFKTEVGEKQRITGGTVRRDTGGEAFHDGKNTVIMNVADNIADAFATTDNAFSLGVDHTDWKIELRGKHSHRPTNLRRVQASRLPMYDRDISNLFRDMIFIFIDILKASDAKKYRMHIAIFENIIRYRRDNLYELSTDYGLSMEEITKLWSEIRAFLLEDPLVQQTKSFVRYITDRDEIMADTRTPAQRVKDLAKIRKQKQQKHYKEMMKDVQ